MAARVIGVGDIHGCLRSFDTLLEALELTADDTLVTLGDVVDRGPDSRGVVARMLELRSRCRLIPILGNHEEMMLEAIRHRVPPHSWIQFGGASTLDSYGFDGDFSVVPEEHLDYLESFLNYYETDTHFFVHANYDPHLPLAEQPPDALRWISLHQYLPQPHRSGKTAVVGHTAEKTGEVFALRHLKCIDTYCYGGQWLTALDTTTGRIFQANELGELRA